MLLDFFKPARRQDKGKGVSFLGAASLVTVMALFIVGAAGNRVLKQREKANPVVSPEVAAQLFEDARRQLSSVPDGGTLRSLRLFSRNLKNESSYLVDMTYDSLLVDGAVLVDMASFPWLPAERRKEMLDSVVRVCEADTALVTIEDELRSYENSLRAELYGLFQGEGPQGSDLMVLIERANAVKAAIAAYVPGPAVMSVYTVKFKGMKGRFRATFASLPGSGRGRLVSLNEMNYYNID